MAIRVCKKCERPESQHPVKVVTEEEGATVVICAKFENAGTLDEIWNAPLGRLNDYRKPLTEDK